MAGAQVLASCSASPSVGRHSGSGAQSQACRTLCLTSDFSNPRVLLKMTSPRPQLVLQLGTKFQGGGIARTTPKAPSSAWQRGSNA